MGTAHGPLALEQELQRVNDEGKKLLGDTVTVDVKHLLSPNGKMLQRMQQKQYAEMHAGKTIPNETVDKILEELKKRLRRATGGKLCPCSLFSMFGSLPRRFRLVDPGVPGISILVHVAKYPRDCLTDYSSCAITSRSKRTDVGDECR